MTKFILICATGRSASTTLQRIINTIPDSNITGEKHGAIEDLLLCYKNIKKTNEFTPKINQDSVHSTEFFNYQQIIDYNIKPAWYNCYHFEDVKENIKKSIVSILSNNNEFSILGYKEIRWKDKIELLNEFVELFPNTKIIIHLRDDLENQIKSGWWSQDSNSLNTLEENNEQFIEYTRSHNNCYLSYMKDLFSINKMEKMFMYLEEPFNEIEYQKILENTLE